MRFGDRNFCSRCPNHIIKHQQADRQIPIIKRTNTSHIAFVIAVDKQDLINASLIQPGLLNNDLLSATNKISFL